MKLHSLLIQSVPVQLIHKRVITTRPREAARRPGDESQSYIHGNNTCTHIAGYTGIIHSNIDMVVVKKQPCDFQYISENRKTISNGTKLKLISHYLNLTRRNTNIIFTEKKIQNNNLIYGHTQKISFIKGKHN